MIPEPIFRPGVRRRHGPICIRSSRTSSSAALFNPPALRGIVPFAVAPRSTSCCSGSLTEDVAPLLPAGVRFDDADALRVFEGVWGELVSRLSGDPWKSSGKVVADLRERGYPTLLQELG